MKDYAAILDYLQKNLGKERYEHSLNVCKEAARLSRHYGYDVSKAELAGLVHDCAKDACIKEQEDYALNCGFKVDDLTYKIPGLIHAPASVYVCRNIFGITDIDILTAIRYHTTGKANMNLLGKILYIADIIEPGREFKEVIKLRELAYKSIDEALLYALDSTIVLLIENKTLLHFDTVDARNYILDRLT